MIAAFSVLALDGYGLSALNLCWIRRTPSPIQMNQLNWLFLFGPIVFIFISSVLVLALATIRFARRQQDLTHRAKRRNLSQYLRYLLVFGLFWALCAVLYYVDYTQLFNLDHINEAFASMFAVYPALLLLVWCTNSTLVEQRHPPTHLMEHFSVTLRKDLMHYTKAGIIRGIRDAERTPLQKRKSDYAEKKRLAANVFTGQHRHYEKLGFTDYAPKVFRDIRELCNISTTNYERSFAETETLMEECSQGKSGMLFYFSKDKRYLVKTMTKSEQSFLLRILPTYHEYLKQNSNSLLCRFLGCHSIQMPVGWNRIFFVVMENVVRTESLIEKYDLKGTLSTTLTAPTERDPLLPTQFSDVDLVHRNQALRLNAGVRMELLAQLTSDCTYLQQQGILDYSCVVGIRQAPDQAEESSSYHEIRSDPHGFIYYIGLCVILFVLSGSFIMSRSGGYSAALYLGMETPKFCLIARSRSAAHYRSPSAGIRFTLSQFHSHTFT